MFITVRTHDREQLVLNADHISSLTSDTLPKFTVIKMRNGDRHLSLDTVEEIMLKMNPLRDTKVTYTRTGE